MRLIIISFLMLCMSCSAWSADNRFIYPLTHVKNITAYNLLHDSDLLYVSNQNQILIYNTFNTWQPRIEAGFYSPFVIEDIETQSANYFYVASREPTNQIVKIDSISASGRIFFPTTMIGDKLTREGATLYVADRFKGIDIVNIGSGGLREITSTFSEKWGIRDFVAVYPFIFALNDFGLVAVDTSDLSNPHSIATNYQIADATYIAKYANTLWVAAGKNLLAFSIINPDNPVLINQYRLANEISAMEIKDNKLYLALGRGGLKILDISNPLKIEELSTINPLYTVYDVALMEDYIFIALGKDGWMIYEYR